MGSIKSADVVSTFVFASISSFIITLTFPHTFTSTFRILLTSLEFIQNVLGRGDFPMLFIADVPLFENMAFKPLIK